MREIDRTLLLLISSIYIDANCIDYKVVAANWRNYTKCWPDDARAMKYLYEHLLSQIVDEHKDFNESLIILGQCMENLNWSFKKIREDRLNNNKGK